MTSVKIFFFSFSSSSNILLQERRNGLPWANLGLIRRSKKSVSLKPKLSQNRNSKRGAATVVEGQVQWRDQGFCFCFCVFNDSSVTLAMEQPSVACWFLTMGWVCSDAVHHTELECVLCACPNHCLCEHFCALKQKRLLNSKNASL